MMCSILQNPVLVEISARLTQPTYLHKGQMWPWLVIASPDCILPFRVTSLLVMERDVCPLCRIGESDTNPGCRSSVLIALWIFFCFQQRFSNMARPVPKYFGVFFFLFVCFFACHECMMTENPVLCAGCFCCCFCGMLAEVHLLLVLTL